MTASLYQNLIKLLGIESLSEKDKSKVYEDFKELTVKIALNCIFSNLSDEEAQQFVSLLENYQKNPQSPLNFAREKIPQLDEKISQEIKKEISKLKVV